MFLLSKVCAEYVLYGQWFALPGVCTVLFLYWLGFCTFLGCVYFLEFVLSRVCICLRCVLSKVCTAYGLYLLWSVHSKVCIRLGFVLSKVFTCLWFELSRV